MNYRILLRAAAIVATGVVSAALLMPTASQADIRGSVSMVGERPVSGTFNLPYKNYSGTEATCEYINTTGYGSPCWGTAFRVSKGTAEIKLHTYRIHESMKRYDYYVVDVEVTNANAAGTSTGGWMKVHIQQAGTTKIIDHTDSVSKSSDSRSCVSIYPSFGAGWGGISAGVGFDPIRFCGKGTSVKIDGVTGLHTVWQANNLRHIRSFVTERIVKVPRGAHPTFKVSAHVPTDSCTSSWNGYCKSYKNGTRLVSWTIHTTGV